jgi:hypothetical protein
MPLLVSYFKGAVAIHVRPSQAGVAVDLVVVFQYLEFQGLEFYQDEIYSLPTAYVTKNTTFVRLRALSWRTAAVRGHTRFVRAQVDVIGDAIAIPIPSACVRGAAAVWRASLFGSQVLGVRDAVAVPVGAAAWLGSWLIETVIISVVHSVSIGIYFIRGQRAAIILKRARLDGAIVFAVARPVAIRVGAPLSYRRASLVGACIFSVEDAVPIPIITCAFRTAIAPGGSGCAGFFGAGICAIGDGIPVGVGAAFGHRWAGLIRAFVPVVRRGIPIGVGAPLGYRWARLVRAPVSVVGYAVPISIRAPVRSFRPWLIRANVGLTRYPIAVPVHPGDGLHVDRGLAPAALGVEGSGDEGVRARG